MHRNGAHSDSQINRGDAPVAPSLKKSAPASGRKRIEHLASFKDRLSRIVLSRSPKSRRSKPTSGHLMKDIHSYLEKLRVQISECEIIRDLATDPEKRELFARLAAHFKVLAGEIEKAIDDPMPITFLGRKTVEPFPREE